MPNNNLKTALRFYNKNKVFAIINGFGLSIAMTVSFIILLYVINEVSYDSFNKNGKRIFRVVNFYKDFNITQVGTPYILASTLKDEYPQVEKASALKNCRGFRLKVNNEFIEIDHAMTANSEIFEIFTFPVLAGSSKGNLLDDMNSLVVSQDLSKKLYPDENPVGKEIVGLVNNEEHLFVITGVFKDIPPNSTLRAQCFIHCKWSIDPINKSFGITNADESWTLDLWTTWIMLSKGSKSDDLERNFELFGEKYISEKPHNRYSLQKLRDVYLKSDNIQNAGIKGNMKNVRLFSLIAVLIILVAAINYVILSTALLTARSREIGIRKTFGAGSQNIRNQLLSESVLIVLIVLPIALVLTWLGLPYAVKLFQTDILFMGPNIIYYVSVYLIIALLIGIISGYYTSTYLSKLQVLDIMKNTINTGKKKVHFRSAMIIAQLLIFCTFVACALIVRSQYKFALSKDTGHFKKDILQIELGFDLPAYTAYLNSIKKNPNVINAAGVMEGIPMSGSMSYMMPNFEDANIQVKVEGLAVDYNFIETMGLEIVKGRSFSEEFGGDLQNSTILNETAVKKLGIKEPVGARLGQKTIIGIVRDFNLHSIHSDIPALSIDLNDKYIHQIFVHYKTGTLNNLLPFLEKEWKKIAPESLFTYKTIEDLFSEIYSSEKKLISIITLASIFTIIIAMFGLFGLTLFIATTRTKEIGIKKVLGASERTIIYSLLFEHMIMVIVATILSVPVVIYFMSKWLNNYSYKVSISWWVFFASFVAATIVVLSTVYFHAYKISRTNPVKALKYE